ncbi:endonuclease [Arthrobacter rhombi]|uniref:endonuclease n=1 Tax=Arthrobacter rhombi TaxID=71253 RepID=UPI0031DF2697
MTTRDRDIVAALLARHGTTYAEEAGIALADKPSPLYELLVLSTLLSARISSRIAVNAARELFAAGLRTPQRMTAATWQQRVNALGRGSYRRYDERTATMLGDGADLPIEAYRADLRSLRTGDLTQRQLSDALQQFPGIGPTGATIFLREVQDLWVLPEPVVDAKVLDGARKLGLPTDAGKLIALAPDGQRARLAAACVRAALGPDIVAEIRDATRR